MTSQNEENRTSNHGINKLADYTTAEWKEMLG